LGDLLGRTYVFVMGKILSNYIADLKAEYQKDGLKYCPGSIYHGASKRYLSKEAVLKMQIERLNDFIEFLFEHSEHCDHISQSDAWDEFEQYEFKQP
jgi:hypothetical protein